MTGRYFYQRAKPFVFVVGLISVIAITAYFWLGHKIEVSKATPWSQELRVGFVQGCLNEAPPTHKAVFEKYCPCMASGLEKAKVIPTEYNTLQESESELEARLAELTGSYLESKEGQGLLKECFERAQIALQLEAITAKPASISE